MELTPGREDNPAIYTTGNQSGYYASSHLRRILEVQRRVQAEVDETKESSVELDKSGHDTVVNITRQLVT